MKLEFFSKDGFNLNLRLDDNGVYQGGIYLPKTSVGIIENDTIYVLEKIKTTTGVEKLVYPSSLLTGTIEAEWAEPDVEELYLFDITYPDNIPTVSKIDGLSYDMHVPTDSPSYDVNSFLVTDDYISHAMQINIAAESDSEGEYIRTLIISRVENSVTTVIAEIAYWFETEGEDVRFKNLLENFGREFNHDNTYLLRDSDIYEDLPDYRLLNQKRKELLIAGDSIFPYLGSYKSLLNVLKFLGYDDLTIKEYWLNVNPDSENYKKFKKVNIEDLSLQPKGINLPNKQFKKTSLFGLYYPINEVTDEVDEYGMPITADSFKFTIEEILIKLYGLKRFLKEHFLPLNARIVDITGEGIYFERYQIGKWRSMNQTFDLTIGKEIDFTVSPTFGALTNLDNRYEVVSDINTTLTVETDPGGTLSQYKKLPISYFRKIEESTLKLEPARIVGLPITLTFTNFPVTWNDLRGMTWSNLSAQSYTWENLGQSDFYELEWVVENKEKYFKYSKRGTIAAMKVHEVIVPYEAEYDITIMLYDTQNNRSMKVKPRVVEAVAQEADFMAVYKHLEPIETWSDLKGKTWGDIKGTWTEVHTKGTTWESLKGMTWNDLNMYNYKDHHIPTLDYKQTVFTIKEVNTDGNYIVVTTPFTDTTIETATNITLSYSGAVKNWNISSLATETITLTTTLHDILVSEKISVNAVYTNDLLMDSSNVVEIPEAFYLVDGQTITIDGDEFTILSTVIDNINNTTVITLDAAVSTFSPSLVLEVSFTVEYIFKVTNVAGAVLTVEDETGLIDYMIGSPNWFTAFTASSNVYDGEYSFDVVDYITATGPEYRIYVTDTYGSLNYINPKWSINWRSFDYGNAIKRSKLKYSWNDLKGLTWNDLKLQSWSNFDYHASSYCTFDILDIAPNGKITINDSIFQFSVDVTDLASAVVELNASTIPHISDFQYQLITNSPEFIQAVAKFSGFGALHSIAFEAGVTGRYEAEHAGESHSYPMTTNMNAVIKSFEAYGSFYPGDPALLPIEAVTKDFNDRHVYKQALSGPFNWNNLKSTKTTAEVPVGTTTFMFPSNSKMAGRATYLWRLLDSNLNLVFESKEPYLIWNFNKKGVYHVYLAVRDINNNVKTRMKNEFIKVV